MFSHINKLVSLGMVLGVSCLFTTFVNSQQPKEVVKDAELLLATAQSRRTEVGKINSYVAEIDRFLKRNPRSRQIVANVAPYDSETPLWKKFKTEAELVDVPEAYENAYLWTKDGKVVATDLTLSSPSGDWAHMIRYYFRDDGSLAKIEAQLNTFYGDVSVIRDQYFTTRGVLLSSTRKFLDLKTQKPIKRPEDYFDHEVPIYKRTSELPFFKIL